MQHSVAERSVIQTLRGQGILLVAASGNDALRRNLISYPAGYDHVMSVAAVDESRRVANFSTHNNAVDIAAPGVHVLSLGSTIGNPTLGRFGYPDYVFFDGTSMATPHVAGVAALVWSQFPDKNVTEIEQALIWSAHDLGSCGKDPLTGHGLVDAVAAAMYLEGGSFASQDGNCISINISLTTDDFGSETMYFVTAADDSYDIFYRGGPYPEGQRATYLDQFSLPNGCYNLMWVDTFGDGSNETSYGIGEITLEYNGTLQVASDALSGAVQTFPFGNCDDDANVTSSPTPVPTSAPVVVPAPSVSSSSPSAADPCSPQSPPTVLCDSGAGESLLQVSLTTDRWAPIENHLYLYDVYTTAADEFIWKVPLSQLEGSSEFEGEACLQPLALNCYQFYYVDKYGDGFEEGGGNLTLSLDGVVVFELLPGDQQGERYEPWSSATLWNKEFGTLCPTTTSNFNRAF